MTENYVGLADFAGLSASEVLLLARNAFSVAWISSSALTGYLDELNTYAAAHGVTV